MENRLPSWKILLVEDNEDDYLITKGLLTDIKPGQVNITWAANHAAALESLAVQLPHVILLDYDLGGSTGLDFLREARARGCRAPAILLTGHPSYDIDLEAMKAGVADYLDKGQVDSQLLERAIRYAIERQQINEELEARVVERTHMLSESNQALAEANRSLAEANRALRENNELIERVFSSIHLHIAYLDRDFNFIRVNRNYAEADGRSEAFFPGKNHFELYPNAENEAIFRKVVTTGEPHFTIARPFIYPDHPEQGATYWDWSIQPIKEPNGQVSGLILTLIDVTEQHRANLALNYQGYLLDNVNDAIVATDMNLRYTSWNPAAEMIYGWTREEALGQRMPELTHPEYIGVTTAEISAGLLETGHFQCEIYQSRKDGRRITVEIKTSVLRDEAGKMTGYVSIISDITQRRQAEAQARQANLRVEAQAELSRLLGAANLDITTIFDLLSARVADLIGDACVVTHLAEDGQSIISVASHHPDPDIDQLLQMLVQDNAAPLLKLYKGMVGSLREPVLLPSFSPERARSLLAPNFWPYLDRFGPYSLLLVPIKIRDRLIGAISLSRDRPGSPYTIEDQHFLEGLAGQAALWISNAELYHAVQNELAERRRVEAELNEIQGRLMDGTEAERLQLSRELHDGPVQDLYGLSMQLRGLAGPLDAETLASLQGGIQHIIDSLRAASMELRPPALTRFGLESAIRSHCEQVHKMQPDLEVVLELEGDAQQGAPVSALSERLTITLFRVYQIALTNVVRHAQAHQVVVRLRRSGDTILLEIQDDGVGFQIPERWIELARQGHLGLVGAMERVEGLGGRMEVHTAPGAGTLIRAVLPNHS